LAAGIEGVANIESMTTAEIKTLLIDDIKHVRMPGSQHCSSGCIPGRDGIGYFVVAIEG